MSPGTSFTVNFYRPSSWGTTIKVYWWAAQPAGILTDGTWPGVNMTNAGNGWYSYTFTNITSTNLIFNDGTNQTVDLTRNKTGWYLNGVWYDTNPGTPVPITGVSLSPASATVNVNATTQLVATVSPANASNQNLIWTSSNTAVATVNTTGLVTGKSGGSATITVTTQDGNKTATCIITVPSSNGTTYYHIVNRWQANTYLYDDGNSQVRYGTNPANVIYQWAKVDAGNGYFLLKNRATDNLMHIENQNGAVQCTAANSTWWSAMWSLPATNDGWSYIQNRWQPTQLVNIEGLAGYAQYTGSQIGWYSAMWQFVHPQAGRLSTQSVETEDQAFLVDIFPNPVQGKQLNVVVSGLCERCKTTLVIRDVYGREVVTTAIPQSGKVNHNLPAGVYFITIQTGKPKVTKKLFVE